MGIAAVISENLKRIMAEHDLSSNELANRSGLPQKTLYTMIQGTHNSRIDNVEKIAKALLVPLMTLVTPDLPTNVLMSQRLPRFTKKYAKLDMKQRDDLDKTLSDMLESD